jgi:hypothetical protein
MRVKISEYRVYQDLGHYFRLADNRGITHEARLPLPTYR